MEKINMNNLNDFLSDTRAGKFTENVPQEVDITIQRVEIQEQEFIIDTEEIQNDSLLYGITC
jgi:hypothetical protein